MKRKFVLTLCFILITFAVACQPPGPPAPAAAPDTRAADESALREWDAQWSKAAGAKDVDKTVSYYSNDALVMPPNAPMTTSKETVRKIWQEMLSAPGFSGGWKADKVEVAKSGEIAYLSGTYEFKWNDAKGKPVTDRGKFVEIVHKQADGSWKCTVDIWNSDAPTAAE